MFSDNFAGAAGSMVNSANWKYDTGPGSSFGTGEIETMTNSTNNVYLDGNGHLVIKAIGSGSFLDVRPHPDQHRQLRSAGGRRARGHRVDRAAQPGQRPRLLARLLDARPRFLAADR